MPNLYNALAALLTYPEVDYQLQLQHAQRLSTAECKYFFQNFAESISNLQTWELQELFTRTFDMNPICSLELGWHLFGENYERGLLLVRVREELRRHGVKESAELPDHLTHVLRLLGRMNHEEAADFAAACVLPALAKMLDAIGGKQNPFENVLLGVGAVLRSSFPEIPLSTQVPAPLLKVLA